MSELLKMVKEAGGEWGKVVAKDDDGNVTSIQIACLGETAEEFLPVVESFEATFPD